MELESTSPDSFRTELCDSLTTLYENILKKAGAGCHLVAKPLARKFQGAVRQILGTVHGGVTDICPPLCPAWQEMGENRGAPPRPGLAGKQDQPGMPEVLS